MTLWIHTLDGRQLTKESDDHSLLYGKSDDLDKVCAELNVPLLSTFFDMTDLEFNLSDEGSLLDNDEEDDDPELDPETGWAYGIDDMKWFDAAAGLETLTALQSHLSAKLKLEVDERDMLLDEIADCIDKLKGPAASGGKFHLAVIM